MINQLVEMSRKYGSNPEYVLAGGGNTSCKDENYLYVKGSGTSLATIEAEGFVQLDRKALGDMWKKTYSENEAEREAQVLEDMMSARCPGNEHKRPSVETLLHNLFDKKFVLHVHPAIVNGLTCAKNGEAEAKRLFPEAVWVQPTKPGYILSNECRKVIEAYKEVNGKEPEIIFLQNHGIFFAADTLERIDELAEGVMSTLNNEAKRFPDFETIETKTPEEVKAVLEELFGGVVIFENNNEISKFSSDKENALPLLNSFTPDHIVYCKAYPLFVENAEDIRAEYENYEKKNGFKAKVVILKGTGMFFIGANEKDANTCRVVFTDAMKIAVYSESFGGYEHMTPDLIDFIVNWEVEAYRSKVNSGE
ncbi:MAG: class II aldolase [Clostridia bacterium]|nr:class II aldolase [Clostridia bacterium]